MLSTAFIIVAILIAGIWILIEVKRMKHKLFAIGLIILIIVGYIGFTVSVQGKGIDLMTIDGVKEAGSLYFSWVGNLFLKVKSVTMYAIGLDWTQKVSNVTEVKNDTIWETLK